MAAIVIIIILVLIIVIHSHDSRCLAKFPQFNFIILPSVRRTNEWNEPSSSLETSEPALGYGMAAGRGNRGIHGVWMVATDIYQHQQQQQQQRNHVYADGRPPTLSIGRNVREAGEFQIGNEAKIG